MQQHWRTSEGHFEAVVMVQHGGDAIKAEAVKFELVYPPARVGQQKAQGLPAACITERACEAPSSLMWWCCKLPSFSDMAAESPADGGGHQLH